MFLRDFVVDFLEVGHEHRDSALHCHHVEAVEHRPTVAEAPLDVGVLRLYLVPLPPAVPEVLRL